MSFFWKAIFTELLGNLAGSPKLWGRAGELLVDGQLSKLPAEYISFEDLLMPSSHGDTQIDHVVFSPYGIFVIETKNYSGWIFAGEKDRNWTQRLPSKYKYKFQNPIRQNYKHIKALQHATGLPPDMLHSVIAFGGRATFKKAIPKEVVFIGDMIKRIRGYDKILLSDSQVNDSIAAVEKFAIRAKRL